MSDKRPNQKRIPESSKDSKRTLLYGLIVVLFVGAFVAGRYFRSGKYDSFAKCLTSKQAKMYGLYWCPHCADQKAEFGESFHYVSYVRVRDQGNERACY